MSRIKYIKDTSTSEPLLEIKGDKITALKDCQVNIGEREITAKARDTISLENNSRQKCKSCGEVIDKSYIRCPHCGYWSGKR